MKNVRVAIVGGTGYGGMELLRYLLGHPQVEITAITSRTETGAVGDVHPHLRGLTKLQFTAAKAVDLAKTNDCLFFATPHGVAKKEVPDVLAASTTVKVVDLSQDWRADALDLERSKADALVAGSIAYGLPSVAAASPFNVQTVGSWPTQVVMRRRRSSRYFRCSRSSVALPSLARASYRSRGRPGPAQRRAQGTHHPERFANLRAYKPLRHQHEEEIIRVLAPHSRQKETSVSFVPVSGSFARGIGNVALFDLSGCWVASAQDPDARIDDEWALTEVRDAFNAAYGTEPFVRLVPDTAEVRAVAGTNFADIGITVRGGVACITVAICNLGKGMAGTAVQNMNLLFGIPETTGLLRPGAGL